MLGNIKTILFLTGSCLVGFLKPVYAEPSGKVGHKAHVHGYAELTVALEAGRVELRLESPAANIVGFEYKATTPEQKSAVVKAKARLESADSLFAFVGSNCTLEKTDIDLGTVIGVDDHHSDHHHDKHDDTHSEIEAVYHFNCQDVSKVKTVSVNLFDQFPALEKLNAMWVTAATQGASELTAISRTIQLRK